MSAYVHVCPCIHAGVVCIYVCVRVCVYTCVRVCVCVCEREREGAREKLDFNILWTPKGHLKTIKLCFKSAHISKLLTLCKTITIDPNINIKQNIPKHRALKTDLVALTTVWFYTWKEFWNVDLLMAVSFCWGPRMEKLENQNSLISSKTVADLCRDWPNKRIFEYPFKKKS